MKITNPFCAVIGAGQVGATTAQRLLEKDLCDVVLMDIQEGLAQGKALDLMQAAAIEGHSRRIRGTTHFEDIAGADIVVITAGLARKPGMSREDLLAANARIVWDISEKIKIYSPGAIVITVTNPLDIMTHLVGVATGFQKQRVFGMAGVLDTARMRFFISEALNIHPRDITALVLGGHGDLMVPVMNQIRAKSQNIHFPDELLEQIKARTQNGGAEIVSLLKNGSAFYAPASSVSEMVHAVLHDTKDILPVSAFVEGPYGLQGIYCGVPAILGKEGVEKIVEIALNETELKSLHLSAQKVLEGTKELEKLPFYKHTMGRPPSLSN